MSEEKKRLGDLLLEYDYIDEEEFEEALARQQESDKRLGQMLVDLGYISEKDLIQVLEFQLQVPYADPEKYYFDSSLAEYLPENIARRHNMVPLKKNDDTLMVAMTDPNDVVAIDDAEMSSGLEIQPMIGTHEEIEAAQDKIYRGEAVELEEITDFQEIQQADDEELEEDELQEMVEEAPVIRLANKIISEAYEQGASDIHIEPGEDKVNVRNRIDGVLHSQFTVPKSMQAALISRFKIMADLDITEHRLPQDGKVKMGVKGEELDMRVSTLPLINGEKVVIRLLSRDSSLLHLDNLGFKESNLDKFRRLIKKPHGILLATGPTGSGKSTTLFAAINEMNRPDRNIVTIEDPVEYQLSGINQVQANEDIGRDFATSLRSVLRQDPDIIMVGEIRDEDTAEIAVRAALTGHLVLSTLHTNDAASTVTRLVDMGLASYLVGASVIGVVAQRLVRRLCPNCRSKKKEIDEVDRNFIGEADVDEIYSSRGCSECDGTGYHDRIAIQEVMPVSEDISRLIASGANQDEIKDKAREEGMMTLKEDGLYKLEQGLTDVEELKRMMF
ncbi:GspE/PulE family protein [Halarsenatibacter silvermanii]|uniref:Type IV pilus assembly protein PilB n=1 Tax=Halarsenatibacter silvermanii TaxID=321763 RepID=A0A1G9LAW0_9FIRM|nr:ATPase, T2SS/T4P/T4SS family [Halarsenatibacter silvermanii]SDL58685.1 type IV pilus assembly protein PilB [Halarsenatibacter silvermanii]